MFLPTDIRTYVSESVRCADTSMYVCMCHTRVHAFKSTTANQNAKAAHMTNTALHRLCVSIVHVAFLLDKSANCLTSVLFDAMYTQRVELPNPVFVFVSSRRKLPCVTAMKHERVATETYENIH